MIKTAIERNFNGSIYTFSKNPNLKQIQETTVPGVSQETLPDKLTDIFFSDMDTIESIDRICLSKIMPDQAIRYISSSGVFKRFFLRNLLDVKEDVKIDKQNLLNEAHTMDLIEQNIVEKDSRFLLLKTENDLVDTIVIERLKNIFKKNPVYKNKIIDWRGALHRENNIELLSTLKNYITGGYIVIMKNLDELYGSLYDLFNQKYSQWGQKKACFLYYGESK